MCDTERVYSVSTETEVVMHFCISNTIDCIWNIDIVTATSSIFLSHVWNVTVSILATAFFGGGFGAMTIARMRAFLQGVAWEVEQAIHKLES